MNFQHHAYCGAGGTGAVLAYLVHSSIAIPRAVPLAPQVRLWTVSLGHTVGFSVLFIRTWRLHSLCSVRHKPAGRVLLLLLLLDVSLLSTWQTVDPLRRVELQLRPQVTTTQEGSPIHLLK